MNVNCFDLWAKTKIILILVELNIKGFMANQIFDALLSEKIENFKTSFSKTSKEIFYDEKAKSFHTLEFGLYRESICKDFLKFIIPSRLDIDDGFIISTKDNNVSTQCDIVIYDSTHTPLFESGKKQRFFPIETVVGIGEIKSTLSKQGFKETINKIARIKKMRRDYENPSIIKRRENIDPFDNYSHPCDQVFSFIICQSLSFDLTNLTGEFDSLYESDIELADRHNMILSINDGLFHYKHIINEREKCFSYPFVQNKKLKNRFVWPGENWKNHFNTFVPYMFMGINSCTVFFPEISQYTGDQVMGVYTDEN